MSAAELPPHLDPRGRHRGGRHNGMHAFKPLARIVGSLVSIALLLVAGYVWYQFRDLNNNTSRLDVQLGAGPTAASGSAQPYNGTDQNILIVGNDDRSTMTNAEVSALHVGRDGGSLATDTMMIVHVPANGSRATLLSLPRDSFVNIPDGYRPNKLNSAYGSAYVDAQSKGSSLAQARSAGANLLVKTITELTGLRVDHYVQVDLLGFYRLSLAIGGVPVTLCRNVDDRGSTNAANGISGGSGFYMTAGRHVLSGVEALEFVRQRHNLPNGDFDRVKRQQYFLTAAFRQVASIGIFTKLSELKSALQSSVYIDGSLNLLDLARQLENLTANNITGKTIPVNADGTLSQSNVRSFVSRLINGTDTAASASASPSPSAAPGTSAASRAPAATPSAPATAATTPAIDSKCIN